MTKLQNLFSNMKIGGIDVCRGINRLRIPPESCHTVLPFRRAFGRKRDDHSLVVDPQWEQWNTLSHRQQIRGGTPTRLLVTMFASVPKEPHEQAPDELVSKRPRTESQSKTEESEATPSTKEPPVPNADGVLPESHRLCHGPLFRALPDKLQAMIQKVHKNLGHPGHAQMKAALQSEGWSETVIQALQDFQCDACHEQQAPKIARPAHLTTPKEFNDMVSFDAVEWRSPQGLSFGFYHFIDSATNFHIAVPFHQGTSKSLIACFKDAWIRWAGPPKSVMYDSCGEANSLVFGGFLKEHDIHAYPIPARAHWQLGRAERHGAILKTMLTKFHGEQPILDGDTFERALIELCNAKNALSRHAGYSPPSTRKSH